MKTGFRQGFVKISPRPGFVNLGFVKFRQPGFRQVSSKLSVNSHTTESHTGQALGSRWGGIFDPNTVRSGPTGRPPSSEIKPQSQCNLVRPYVFPNRISTK